MDLGVKAVLKTWEEPVPVCTKGIGVYGKVVGHGPMDTLSLPIGSRMIGSSGMGLDVKMVHDGLGDAGSELCPIVCHQVGKWAKFEYPIVHNSMGDLGSLLGFECYQHSVLG